MLWRLHQFILWRRKAQKAKHYLFHSKLLREIHSNVHTLNNNFSRALCLAERVKSDNLVFTAVSWLDSKYVHGAHAAQICDEIIFIQVDADII